MVYNVVTRMKDGSLLKKEGFLDRVKVAEHLATVHDQAAESWVSGLESDRLCTSERVPGSDPTRRTYK